MAHRQRQHRQERTVDQHHLMFSKATWQRERFTRLIRQHQGLIVPLPIVEVHRPLHRQFYQGVPLPDRESARAFNETVLPYEPGQPWDRTLEQAIGWFAMTDNLPTAEHLYEQHEFIAERLEGLGYGQAA